MEREAAFLEALKKGEALLLENKNRFIFLGEKPRFANHNLGWIEVGEKNVDGVHEFKSWKYRPEIEACQQMFASGTWLWNPGYFLFDIDFVLALYEQHQPELFATLSVLVNDEERLKNEYGHLPSMSFDNAIVEKTEANQAVVLPIDMGWSDPGTLYALKEALTNSEEENYLKGRVLVQKTRDSFVYNEEENKLVTTIGLDGVMVINTKDALLVCPKDLVPEIKELLKKIETEGLGQHL
jgi:mannose-1-phosphate guanylyltransferase